MDARPLDAEVLLEHGAFVRAVVLATLGADDEVEDVVQDTWLAALRPGPTRTGSLRSWLGGVARRQARLRIRSRRRERRRLRTLAERGGVRAQGSEDAEALTRRLEIGRRVVGAVLALPEHYRNAVVLRYHEDLPPREIAKRLDLPVETVRTRVKRGLALLRERLESDGDREGKDWRALLLPLVPDARSPVLATTTTATVGAAVMSKKLVLAVAVLLVLGGTTAWLRPWEILRGSTSREGAPTISVSPGADGDAESPRAHLRGRTPPADAKREAPPPVDFAAVDLDRDLHGIVVDGHDRPVAGARLQAVRRPWRETGLLASSFEQVNATREGPRTISGADGSFVLRLATGELVSLRAEAEGLATLDLWGLQAGSRVRIVLSVPVRLAVRVSTPEHEPAVGVVVWLMTFGRSERTLLDRKATTDADGRAEFGALPAGVEAGVMCLPRHAGWGMPEPARTTTPVTGTGELEIILLSGRVIRGHVRDARTKAAIEGARVGLSWVLLPSVTTGEDGAYELPGFAKATTSDVYALAPGYARAKRAVGTQERVDFELVRGTSVRGRIVGRDGKVLAGALVSVFTQGDPLSLAAGETDEAGSFLLDGLTPHLAHALTVAARGHALLQTTLMTLDSGATLDLGRLMPGAPCTLRGLVSDERGDVQQGVEVALEPGRLREARRAPRPAPRRTDERGRFGYHDLPPGPWMLRISRGGAVLLEHTVELSEETPDVRLELTLPERRPVRVHLRTTDGDAIPGITIHASVGGKRLAGAVTDGEGFAEVLLPFEPVLLMPGIALAQDPYLQAPARKVAPHETEVEIVLEPAAVITGRLLDLAGEPIPYASLRFDCDDGSVHHAVTFEEGRFRWYLPRNRRVRVVFLGDVRPDPRLLGTVWRPLAAELADVATDAKDLVLRAHAVATDRSLTLRVVGPDGQPVEDVPLQLLGRGLEESTPRTDASGSVHLAGLPALPLRVQVTSWPTRERPWRAPKGQEVVPDGQEVVLPLQAGRTVEGVLLRGDGNPAALGGIQVYRNGTFDQRARCDDQGRFVVVFLAGEEDPVELRAIAIDPEGQWFEVRHEGLRPGAGPIVLRLRPRPAQR